MISYIKGRVIQIEKGYLVVENSGMGYEITMTDRDLSILNKNEDIEIFIYTSYSMYEGIKLYGFLNENDKKLFELIKSQIPNTGNSKAMDYLNKIQKSVSDFSIAVAKADEKALKNMFGFSSKTAKKIIDFLKDRIYEFYSEENSFVISSYSQNYDSAFNALINLGYRASEAKNALSDVISENRDKKITVEEMIKQSLRKLSQR
ncbi:MAG: Holliday junction branch migration protein RuvA [Elusimicrobiales bacterium]